MLPKTSKYRLKLIKFLLREQLKRLQEFRFFKHIRLLLLVSFLFSGTAGITWFIWFTRPTETNFIGRSVFYFPLTQTASTQSPVVSPAAGTQATPTRLAENMLFDQHEDTFVLLDKNHEQLIVQRNQKRLEFPAERISARATALRVHKKMIVVCMEQSEAASENTLTSTPKLSLALLNLKNGPAANFIAVYPPTFILPYTQRAREQELPQLTLQNYGDKGMYLRISKEIIINISPDGYAEWINVTRLVKPYLVGDAKHLDTVLSPLPAEIYFIILIKSEPPYDIAALRYQLSTRTLLARYNSKLHDFTYFTIADNGKLITTRFHKRKQGIEFQLQPLHPLSLGKVLRIPVTLRKPQYKTLAFANKTYPKSLRFTDNSFIGFYETEAGLDFWRWD